MSTLKIDDRVTSIYMTHFERARILGLRASQIALHCRSTIPVDFNMHSPLEIAEMELDAKKIPVIIRRYLSDNVYEDWDANELLFVNKAKIQ